MTKPNHSANVEEVAAAIEAYDALDFDQDCWNCGGEGYIADCFDGLCVNAEDGCSACMRRCEYCNAPKRAASGIETGTAKSEALSAKHESPTGEAGDAMKGAA